MGDLGSSGAVSCSVGHRCGSHLALLWLWCRPAAAAPFGPLAWELPYAAGAALKKIKKKKGKKEGTDALGKKTDTVNGLSAQ